MLGFHDCAIATSPNFTNEQVIIPNRVTLFQILLKKQVILSNRLVVIMLFGLGQVRILLGQFDLVRFHLFEAVNHLHY